MIAAYFWGFSHGFSVLLQEEFLSLVSGYFRVGSIAKFNNSGILMCLGFFFLEMS